MPSAKCFDYWLGLFCENWQKPSPSDQLYKLYFKVVKEIPDEEFSAIAEEIIKNETFWPPAGTFAKYRKNAHNYELATTWDKIIDFIKRTPIESLRIADLPVSEEVKLTVKRLGGLRAISDYPEIKLPDLYRQFVSTYQVVIAPKPNILVAQESQGLDRNESAQLMKMLGEMKNAL